MLVAHQPQPTFFLHLLPLNGPPTPAAADVVWNWSGCYCLIVFHFHIFSRKEKKTNKQTKATGEHRGQNKTVLSVAGKSMGREEPLMLLRQEVWRPLPAKSATAAMPRKRHGDLQVATEIHLALDLLKRHIAHCTHKVAYTQSELALRWKHARYNQRLWMQKICCQNVTVQLMAWLNFLSSLKGMTAGVNFCIKYQRSPLQILPCDWLWLKKALLLNLIR